MRSLPAKPRRSPVPILLRPFVKARVPMLEWRRERADNATAHVVMTMALAADPLVDGSVKAIMRAANLVVMATAYGWAVHVWAREFPGHRSYRADRWHGDREPTIMDRLLHEPWTRLLRRG